MKPSPFKARPVYIVTPGLEDPRPDCNHIWKKLGEVWDGAALYECLTCCTRIREFDDGATITHEFKAFTELYSPGETEE